FRPGQAELHNNDRTAIHTRAARPSTHRPAPIWGISLRALPIVRLAPLPGDSVDCRFPRASPLLPRAAQYAGDPGTPRSDVLSGGGDLHRLRPAPLRLQPASLPAAVH